MNFHSTLSIIDMAIESKEKLSKKKKKKPILHFGARRRERNRGWTRVDEGEGD